MVHDVKVKAQLSLCLTKHYVMKTCGNGCIDSRFMTSASVGVEWSASRTGHFTPVCTLVPFDRRLRGPQSRSGLYGQVKILPLWGDSNFDP
jgi:hypothetical protein